MLPIGRVLMKTFESNDKVYDLFKSHIARNLKSKVNQTVESKDIKKSVSDFAKKFRKKWVEIVNEQINVDYQEFKVELAKNLVEVANQQNPYANFEGNKLAVLPDNVKMWFRGTNTLTVVLEEKPIVRTVRTDKDKWNKNAFSIAFPYCIFIIVFRLKDGSEDTWHFENLRFAFSQKSLQSTDDELFEAPLPDLQETKVCMGKEWDVPKNGTIANKTDRIITYFWTSYFKWEWIDNISRCKDERLKYFNTWEEATQENALFILKAKLTPVGTLRSILAGLALTYENLFSTKLSQKIIENSIAKTWESIRENYNAELKDLETSFNLNVTSVVNHVAETVYSDVLSNFDNFLSRSQAEAEVALNELMAKKVK